MENYSKHNFEPGKVIVSIKQAAFCPIKMADMFDGIDHHSKEVIFPFKNDGNKIGDILSVNLKCNKEETVHSTINQLLTHPHVYHAEPNYLFDRHLSQVSPPKIPNDPYFQHLWGMRKIDAPLGWNYTTGNKNIIVGVADSGIDYNHPDIIDNLWVSKNGDNGWNFINNDNDPMDQTGHGTHVAGTIGAVGNNGIGVTGVCWQVKLAALRIGNNAFSLEGAIQSIHYSNENAIEISNNSWGGRQFSPTLKHAIDNYNGLFIASAGNSGTDNDITPSYPASFDCPNIISVAATNPYDNLAPFSNYGAKTVHIAAPGTDIFSLSLNGQYSGQSGTSMSAPHVTGAAALIKGLNPGLNPLQIKDIILKSATKLPSLKGKVVCEGVLNVNRMLSSMPRN